MGNELFDVYSATKVVTMTAVMQLVEQGKLDLEQEVADFIPEFADTPVLDHYDISAFPYPKPDFHGPVHKRKKPIRLRHLMTMTAGLSYDLDNAFLAPLAKANADTQTIVRAIAKMPLLFEPGEHYRYSLGHDVMAAVVELVSGELPQLNKQQELEFGRGKLGYSYGLGVRTLIYPEKSRSPEGEFGWDGAAGAFAMVDPKNHISMFFAPEVMSMPKLYFDVHPVIRDTFYQCLQEDAKA